VDVAEHFPSHLNPSEEDYEGYPHHLSLEEAQELADSYCVEKLTMARAAEEASISLSSFKDFRRAHSLRKGKAVIVDETKSIEEGIEHFSEEAKRREIDRKARKKQRREMESAAKSWWRLQESLEEAATAFEAESYDPPRLRVRMTEAPSEPGSVVANAQDYHIGKRPAAGADDWSVGGYCDRLVGAFERGLEQAARSAQLDRVYLVVGGDLVHVDTGAGTTTSGTPQDLAVGPTEALKASVEAMVQHVDLARQVASEVRLVGLTGNHDKVLSQACFEAVRQRFHSTSGVSIAGTGERIYDVYGDRLLAFTHGDMKKKVFRKIGDTITSECRDIISETRDTTLFTGHYHFKARDVIDESGRLQLQAPSPSPDDEYHVGEGYVGARKQIQLYLTRPDSQDDMTIGMGLQRS